MMRMTTWSSPRFPPSTLAARPRPPRICGDLKSGSASATSGVSASVGPGRRCKAAEGAARTAGTAAPVTTRSATRSASISALESTAPTASRGLNDAGDVPCWRVCVSSCASRRRPAAERGASCPSANTMCCPTVYASAPTALAEAAALSSACTRIAEKSRPNRGSMYWRAAGSSGVPGERNTASTASGAWVPDAREGQALRCKGWRLRAHSAQVPPPGTCRPQPHFRCSTKAAAGATCAAAMLALRSATSASGARSRPLRRRPLRLAQPGEEGVELARIQSALLLRGVDRVDDRVGLVAVLDEEGPAHLLLAAPGDADRAALRVAGHVDVVAVARVRLAGLAAYHGPRLAGIELGQRRVGQAEAEADADIHEHRALDLAALALVDLREGLDPVAPLRGEPALAAPLLQRIEHDQAAVRSTGFAEVFVQHVVVADRDQLVLFGLLEAQGLVRAAGDHAVAVLVVAEHRRGDAVVHDVEVVLGRQHGRRLQQGGKHQVAVVASGLPFAETHDAVGTGFGDRFHVNAPCPRRARRA